MLATFERLMLIERSEKLAEMILNSDVAEHYRNCLYKLKSNKETQQKVHHFAGLKEKYEEAQRFGKHHPDYKKIVTEMREAKREMDLDPFVASFKLAENDLQDLLDQISVFLGEAVSKQIKVPTGNPFFETSSSCGGSCGSGGCSCSV